MFKRERTLRTYLIVLLTGTTLFTLLVVSAGILLFRVPQVLHENQVLLSRVAKDTAGKVELFLGALQRETELVAIALDGEDPAKVARLLQNLRGNAFEAVYLISPDGTVVANNIKGRTSKSSSDFNGVDLSASHLFKTAMSRSNSVWSDKFLSIFSGNVTTAVAVPVQSTGQIIVGELPLAGLLEISRFADTAETLDLWIIDRSGEIVADTGTPSARGRNVANLPVVEAALTRSIETSARMDYKGAEYAVAASLSDSIGWVFVTRAPYGLDNPRIRELVHLMLLAMVGSPLVGFLLAPFWARYPAAELAQVTSHAREVAEGRLLSSWPRVTISEFNELSGNLETMSRTLADREKSLKTLNEDLESRIAERTRELSDSTSQLQTIIDSSPVGIGVVVVRDGSWKLKRANQGLVRFLGTDLDDLIDGDNSKFWTKPEERAEFYERARNGERIENVEMIFLRGGTEPITSLFTMKFVQLSNEDAVIFWAYDIEDRKKSEEALKKTLQDLQSAQTSLIEAEKMASLGNLVAGVAHEINTPVGIGITAMSHLRDATHKYKAKYEDQKLSRPDLEAMFKTTEESTNIAYSNLERAASLVKSFKRVAVDQTSEKRETFSIKSYLDELLISLTPQLKKSHLDVEVDCDPDLQVDSYPGVFAQIFTNLIMNSLTHGYPADDHGTITINASRSGEKLILNYSDDGCGMENEIKKNIFEPFFTTKRGTGGTGLGMNIVFNLVNQKLKGTITCESQPGEGTRFSIILPADLQSGEENVG